MIPLFFYPVYSKIFSFLEEYDQYIFCKVLGIKYYSKFKNGRLNCKGFKPDQLKNLNLEDIDVNTLNWDACCRHRFFTKNEIVKYLKYISLSHLHHFSNFDLAHLN
jgi:hypothetical protein